MKVIKRDQSIVDFDKNKIRSAICKAMRRGSGEIDSKVSNGISDDIYDYFHENNITPRICDIEQMVYDKLIEYGCQLTAKYYEGYRAVQAYKRENNTTDESILGLLDASNREVLDENSNKNGKLISTQRDLIAGEVSKDIAKRKLIPSYIVEAHQSGAIHYHDMDYAIQKGCFNCFTGDTKFVTDFGNIRFDRCKNGQIVNVLDKDGNWRQAVVRNYGKQMVQTVTLTSGRTERKIRCTSNHRWVLKDGTVTTDLKVGDRLWTLKNMNNNFTLNPYAFCLGFLLGDGSSIKRKDGRKTNRIRLCGEKAKYLDLFLQCGYTLSDYRDKNNMTDLFLFNSNPPFKDDFLQSFGWRFMSYNDLRSLFIGYYGADGFKDRNAIATSNPILAQMIREISSIAGYHITSEKFEVRNTNYKSGAELFTFRFMVHQPANKNWIVKNIEFESNYKHNIWCVEEPVTHTFTLEGGIVTGNCCLINLEDMLQNGTVINKKLVEPPKSFSTACTVATQIIAQIASGQFGGNTITIRHLAPFLRVSYNKYYNHYIEKGYSEELARDLAKDRRDDELKSGIQTIRYQISTLNTTNGQSPFCTIALEIVEGDEYEQEEADICYEMIRQRLEGMKNYKGQTIGEEFPKLVYVLDEHNCLEGGKYDYITKLSAKCNTKRLVPDYLSAKMLRQNYKGEVVVPMGCRAFLSPWKDENGNYKWWGRFNQGPISLNLVQVALIANKDMDKFWKLLDDRCELAKDALMVRHNLLKGATSDVSPIHWQHGAIARLKPGEKIDKLLEGGYSTLALGYVGIYEMTQAMLGVSHTTPEGEKFALEVMHFLRNKCDTWKKETGLGFALYGTPGENTDSRFCELDRKRFGVIKNVTDKGYYTNSYHVHVTEEIDAFSKLKFESQFQKISSGGCISYIEVPDMSNNLEAVEQVINFIYHNIQYAEINTKPDTCYECGYEGEMKVDENMDWYCPNCGNKNKDQMQVMRRTCGYIGSNFWSKGRTKEIIDRVLHL